MDVKFGVSINDQLNDEILVSVIASDFEEEIDFSSPSTYQNPVRQPEASVLAPLEKEESEEEKGENNDIDVTSILPGFLNN